MKSPITFISQILFLNAMIYGCGSSTKPENPSICELNLEPICTGTQTDGKSINIVAVVKGGSVLSAYLKLNLNNAKSSIGEKKIFQFSQVGNQETQINLAKISRDDPNSPMTFTYEYKWKWGRLNQPHDDILYRLPYNAGEVFKVMQGYNSSYSHNGSLENSLDFDLPEGSEIVAARSGKIIGIKQDSSEGGTDKEKYSALANYVMIAHSDNTVGAYMHLKKDGALVEVGEEVSTGDIIGLSGNTGWSTAPHLHFHVATNYIDAEDNLAISTVATKFITKETTSAVLIEGQSYEAVDF